MFYGLVEDPNIHNGVDETNELREDEFIVKFVVSGEYEWYNKSLPNCLVGNYKKSLLVLCHPPPVNMSSDDYYRQYDDATKWFNKS